MIIKVKLSDESYNKAAPEIENIEEINDKAKQYLAEVEKNKPEEYEEEIVPLYELETGSKPKVKVKKQNSIPWRNYLIYLVIITSLSCCFTFSRYITEVTSSGSGTVAKFDVQVNSPDLQVYTDNSSINNLVFDGYLGDTTKTSQISVKNNGEVTVDVEVSISGSFTNHTYTLKDGATTVTNGYKLSLPANSEAKTFVLTVNKSTSSGDLITESNPIIISFDSTQID